MKLWCVLAVAAAANLAAASGDSPAGPQDTPEAKFRKALSDRSEKALEEACRELVALGLPPQARLILESLTTPHLDADLYWIMVRACAAFSGSDGLREVAAYVVGHKGRPAARDLAMAL